MNKFRFVGFTEKISKIRIDVYHKIGEVRDLSDASSHETYFKETLIKWRELNCSKHFTDFSKEVLHLVQDLRQIIYHQDQIIEIICRYLSISNCQCYDALLDLVAQTVKDLRNEFYQHFPVIFEKVTALLHVHDAEVVEQAFTCLAYIFKYSWRYMLEEPDEVYSLYKKLLTSSQKPHIYQFAAESLSFLVRRLKMKDGFFDVLFLSVKEDPTLAEGIGCLLFETIKGVNHMFHSCSKDVLHVLFRKIEPSNTLRDVVGDCLSLLVKAAVKHTNKDHCQTLLESLLTEVEVATNALEKQLEIEEEPKISIGDYHAYVGSVLGLLKIVIDWNGGKFISSHWQSILKLIKDLLKLKPLLSTADAVSDVIASLLKTNIPDGSKQAIQNIIKCLLFEHLSVNQLESLTQSVRECEEFHELVWKNLFTFVESKLLEKSDLWSCKSSQMLLKLLSENITEMSSTFRIPYSGVVVKDKLLEFDCSSVEHEAKTRLSNVPDMILEVMERLHEEFPESSGRDLIELSEACVVCLPFLRPLDKKRAVTCLEKCINKWIDVSESESFEHTNQLFRLISHAVQSMSLLLTAPIEEDATELRYHAMLSLLRKHPGDFQILAAFDCYCKMVFKHGNKSLSSERQGELYDTIKRNLSSSVSVVRLLTLRILSCFQNKGLGVGKNDERVQPGFDRIATCLEAEEIPATFEKYLEKLMHLRKLSFNPNHQQSYHGLYNDVVPRYLIGSLLINLRPMWEPVMEIITSYTEDQNAQSFWLVFSSLLHSSFNDQEESDSKSTYETDRKWIQYCYSPHNPTEVMSRSAVCCLLCQLAEKFPRLAERKSRDIIPLFMTFLRKEYGKYDASFVASQDIRSSKNADIIDIVAVEDQEDEPASLKNNSSRNSSSDKKKIFTAFLQLFSQFKNPKALYMENELYRLYLELLCHRENDIQSLAFSCLKTYKFPYLKSYEESFERILQDHTFKDELTVFVSQVEKLLEVERGDVMDVLIRLLFGKFQRRSGLGVSGKKNQAMRRNILVNFMSNCTDKDIARFLGLISEPFRELLEDGSEEVMDVRLDKVIPLRKQIGYMNMLKTILKRLANSVQDHVPKLFKILLALLRICALCLKQRAEIDQFSISQLKTIRQTGLARIVDFFEIYTEIDFNVFAEEVFQSAVLPQIDNVEMEAHQVTPLLKLIHCWSKIPLYHSLLERSVSDEGGDTVLLRVFSALKTKTKSMEVSKLLMSIAENLLQTDKENGESASRVIIMKYLDLILEHLNTVIKSKSPAAMRSSRGDNHQLELKVLAEVSLFVREPDQCQSIINILFPTVGSISDETHQVNTLKTIKNLLANCQSAVVPCGSLSIMFASLKGKITRSLLCDIFEVVVSREGDVSNVSELVSAMNSWDSKRVEEPDYDRRLKAFAAFSDVLLNGSMSNKDIKPLLCTCIHYSFESSDISIRDSSLSCIAHIIDLALRKKECYEELVEGLLIPRIKSAMRVKNEITRAEYIHILSVIVKNFDSSPVSDLKTLTSDDPEMDFFENIRHIQVHRRIKAVRQLTLCVKEKRLKMHSLHQFLLPMVSHFITEHDSAKDHNIVSETIESIGCITGCLTWQKYSHILRNYLRLLSKEKIKQKTMLRIVVSILNEFPFDLSILNDTTTDSLLKKVSPPDVNASSNDDHEMETEKTDQDVSDDEMIDEPAELEEPSTSENIVKATVTLTLAAATKIHDTIVSKILPLLHKSLTQKSFVEDFHRKSQNKQVDEEEILRVPLALAMTKLLQQLPKATLEKNLPGILLRVCQSLKSRARDVRDTARTTLIKMASSLGPPCFHYVLQEMTSVLKRGYQLHVLSYTLKGVLDGLDEQLCPGDLDSCLLPILEVLINDIFHNVTDEKEQEGIKGKLHEAKSNQSYDSFEIVARYSSESTFHDVVHSIQKLLETGHSHVIRNKAKEVLRRISIGFQKNLGLTQKILLVFIYQTLSLFDPSQSPLDQRNGGESKGDLTSTEDIFLVKKEPGRLKETLHQDKNANLHLLSEFGLQLFHLSLKRSRQQTLKQEVLELLDPYVAVLGKCLDSKHNKVIQLSTKCLALLVQFPLPSIKENIDGLAASLFKLLKKFCRVKTATDENRELVASSFKAMTVLLRDERKCKISKDQLKILLTFVEEDIYDHTQQGTAFPLLKAILSRKLNVPEIAGLMEKISKISITSHSQSVQLQCRQLMLQYLLDYPLGKKSEIHLEFYINQLEYEWENGRQSALEMLALIFKHFPQMSFSHKPAKFVRIASRKKSLKEYAGFFFVPLVMKLINDDSAICRKLTIAVIKTMLEKLSPDTRTELYELVLNWLQQEKVPLKRLAAQLIGTFAEVEGAAFEKRLNSLLPVFQVNLKTYLIFMEEDDMVDQYLFFALCSLKKIFQNCNALTNTHVQDDLLQVLASCEDALQHPHVWIRLSSCQLFGLLFGAWTPEEVVRISKDRTSKYLYWAEDLSAKVRLLCVRLSEQLKDEISNEFAEQITKNLIYLAKMINVMEDGKPGITEGSAEENVAVEDEVPKGVSLKWILRRMLRLASREASQSQNSSFRRVCVFRWIAAISLDLRGLRLKPLLTEILQPLHRETVSAVSAGAELQKLAREVISLIKEIVGKEVFAENYSKMQRSVTQKKENRKRQRLEEAITDQEKFALKKKRRNMAKQEQKKRKFRAKKL